jgi:hypothetical protein
VEDRGLKQNRIRYAADLGQESRDGDRVVDVRGRFSALPSLVPVSLCGKLQGGK